MTKRVLIVWLVLAALAAPAAVCAEEAPLTVKLRDVEYGLFEVVRVVDPHSHLYEPAEGFPIATVTDQIPLRQGVMFGVRMRIDADRGQLLQVVVTVEHPSLNRRFPPTTTLPMLENTATRVVWIRNAVNGGVFHAEYVLQKPWQMVPGDWTMDIELVGIDEAFERVDLSNRLPLYRRVFHLSEPAEGHP